VEVGVVAGDQVAAEAEAEALVVYCKPLVWLLRPELH
jgi:hypothetical protein